MFYQSVGILLLGISGLGLGISGLGEGGPDAFDATLGAIVGIPLVAMGAFALRDQARLRRSQLRIGRSELTIWVVVVPLVVVAAPAPIVIPRGAFQGIDTKVVDAGEKTARQFFLVYGGGGAQPETIQIGSLRLRKGRSGLDLNVNPQNLERALAVWKDGRSGDPELLDRVEALLRGR